MGGIDWGQVQQGGTPSPTPSPVPTAPSGGIDWGKLTGGAAPSPSSSTSSGGTSGGHGKSLFAKIVSGTKDAVEGLPAGIAQLGKDLGVTAVHAGENVVNDIAGSHLGPPTGWRDHGGLVASQQEVTDTLNQRPALRGMVEGFKRSGNEIVHPTQIARNYSADPVGSLLNDVANASLVLGPIAKVSAAGADAAEAGRLGAGLGKAADITEKVASAPALPFKLAGKGLGELGSRLYGAASENGGTVGETLRWAKLDPASRSLRKDALTPGNEAVGEATGRQVSLATKLQRIVPDPVEQEAMFVVGEGQGPALAKLRAASPDKFDAFVQDHFGGSLSPEAARLAADVADRKAPEAAARIDQALQVGHDAPGGRAERSATYLAGSGVPEKAPYRAWEAGFEPNPAAIDKATEKAMQGLPKAERLAKTLRTRADLAAEAYNTAKEGIDHPRLKSLTVTAGEGPSLDEWAQSIREQHPGVKLDVSQHRDGHIEVSRVVVPEDARNSGIGSAIMRDVLDRADAEGRIVSLTPSSDFGGSKPRLVKWYKSLGFEPNKGPGRHLEITDTMVREPRPPTAAPAPPTPKTPAPPTAPPFGQAKAFGKLEARAQSAQTLAGRSEAVLGRLRDRVKATAAETAASVDAAPARLRPVLETNRAVTAALADHAKTLRTSGLADDAARVEHLAADIPTTLKALQAAGVNPDHFIHIQPGDKPNAAGVRTGTTLPTVRKGREEKFRGQSTVFDRTIRSQTQAELDTAKTVIARQTAAKIADMPFAARLGVGPLDGITTKEAAAKAGYVPWDPRSPFETPATVDRQTVFLPEHLKNGFRSYFSSPAADRIAKLTYDPLLGMFKGGVLALSPSWHIGNIFGNLSMATIGGGVNPIELARSIGEAVKQYRASGPAGERTWEGVGPRRLFTAGPTHEEIRFLNDAETARKGSVIGKAADKIGENKVGRGALTALRAPGAVMRKSYALNEFVDNIGRSAVYIAKKSGGLSDEAALSASLKAMGDFSRMTPLERRVVRRIVPFYAWQRHITQLALRLPVEAPIRTAWLLHLGDTYAKQVPDDGTPDYLRFAVPLGSKLLEGSRFVPFGDAGRPLEPTGVASSLSPLIKIPVQSYLGVNLQKGKPFTRPPGTGRHDEFGSPLPTAPSLAKQATDLFPQKRVLGTLTGRDSVVRYDTGDKVLTKKGTIPSGKSTTLGLLRAGGIPLDDKAKAAEMAKAVAKKQLSEAKARAAYERRLNK